MNHTFQMDPIDLKNLLCIADILDIGWGDAHRLALSICASLTKDFSKEQLERVLATINEGKQEHVINAE